MEFLILSHDRSSDHLELVLLLLLLQDLIGKVPGSTCYTTVPHLFLSLFIFH